MNIYTKGFVSGFFLCLSIIILIGATKPNSSNEQKEIIKKRSIIYSKALYSINCDGLSKKQIVNKIKKIHESD